LRSVLILVGLAVSACGEVSSGKPPWRCTRRKSSRHGRRCYLSAQRSNWLHAQRGQQNDFGSYRIDDLLPGAYTVTAQHDGFQTVTVSPFFVEVNQKARLDLDLHLGSAHDTVTVNASTSPLQTDEASEGYQLGSDFIEALPLMTSCPNPPSWRGIAPGPNVTSVMILRPSNGTALNPVYYATDYANSGTPNRPNVVLGQSILLPSSQRNADHFYNAAAISNPAPYTFGDVGRDILPGPGNEVVDVALHRRFPVKENKTIEFRAETFNVLNHPNFGIPGPYPDFGPFFGKAFSAGDPRRMQFALRFDF
jgi:hypothetical protein